MVSFRAPGVAAGLLAGARNAPVVTSEGWGWGVMSFGECARALPVTTN